MVQKDLSPQEQSLFDAINQKDLDGVKKIIEESGSKQLCRCVDSYGTTPLQQAAFKGSVELVKYLLDNGADPNSNEHEHGYTALMFGALSGSSEVCTLLLEAGAETYKKNSVGKTASEMAAFTGQHHCVSTINNFLAQEDLEQVIIKSDKDRLPKHLIPKLHELSRTYNVHPVKTLFFLNENKDFLDVKKSLLDVLEDVMDRQMKQKDTNEVMALKLHVIRCTLREAFKYIDKEGGDVIKFAKVLLATQDSDSPKSLDLLVRQCIKEFPYQHSVILQQIVKTLSKVPVGSHPTAMTIMRQSLLGQRMLMDEVFCATCGEGNAHKRCSACKSINYCSASCQKLHWFAHKKWCPQLAEKAKQRDMERKAAQEINPSSNEESAQSRDEPEATTTPSSS